MENQKNARYQTTHELLKEIYKNLLLEDPERKVTVAMITKRAEVNRKTFYLHFEVIEELVTEVARDLAGHLALKCQGSLPDPHEVEGIFQAFFASINDDLPFHQHVITSKQAFFLYEEMMRFFVADMVDFYQDYLALDRTVLDLLFSYISSGMMMFYRKWLWNGQAISEEEFIQLGQSLVSGSIEKVRS